MLALLLALAMTYPFQETAPNARQTNARLISKAHAEAAVAILNSAPHPVKVRLVSVGPLGGPTDSYSYLFNQIVSLFIMTEGRWHWEDIEQVSQKDAGTTLGQGIGCSAVDADGEGSKIISSAMAAAGYPCSHEAAGYAPPPKPTEPSGWRPLITHTPVQEVVISIGR
jgi:hypothetical protein